jgi:site-specific DNA-methyltransferase (adenine-specific)
MSIQASFALRGRNPDVLTCIANLSNDEVFTPPEFANQRWSASRNFFSDTSDGEPSIIADAAGMKASRSLKSIQPLATIP